jgi:hypothetical protein
LWGIPWLHHYSQFAILVAAMAGARLGLRLTFFLVEGFMQIYSRVMLISGSGALLLGYFFAIQISDLSYFFIIVSIVNTILLEIYRMPTAMFKNESIFPRKELMRGLKYLPVEMSSAYFVNILVVFVSLLSTSQKFAEFYQMCVFFTIPILIMRFMEALIFQSIIKHGNKELKNVKYFLFYLLVNLMSILFYKLYSQIVYDTQPSVSIWIVAIYLSSNYFYFMYFMNKLQALANRSTYYSLIGWMPSLLIVYFSLNRLEIDENYYLPYSFVVTSFLLLLFSKVSARKMLFDMPHSYLFETIKFVALVSSGTVLQSKMSNLYILSFSFVALSLISIYVIRCEVEAD